MAELLESTFRIVNRSFANGMALLCATMSRRIWEASEAANTKPFGLMPSCSGSGLGGHCIPLDSFHLFPTAREHDFATQFIDPAGESDDRMPPRVIEILAALRKPISEAEVLLLGATYKRNIDDVRESAVPKIAHLLRRRGAQPAYEAPHVPSVTPGQEPMPSADLTGERLASPDLVRVATGTWRMTVCRRCSIREAGQAVWRRTT